jgi:TatD DNase family protein
MYFDTHVHLNDGRFNEDRSAVLDRALAQGVTRMVEIADAPAEWAPCLALARARPDMLRCALGVHPYYADQYAPPLLEDLAKKVKLPEVVAVGEIGLDYVKAEVAAETQRAAFIALLDACKAWDVPAVIHCRGAYPDLLAILRDRFTKGPRFHGVIHCFTGLPEEAVECKRLGFALGADGPVTYPKNDALREAFREVGPDVTVLETDSPWLPPQSSRGKRNEPAAIPEINARLADVWRLPPEEAARRTTAAAHALYRL